MKLVKARIRRYRSIEDAESFEIEDAVTCLVGKNESGKTAVLQALFKSNPVESGVRFDEVLDFPSRLTKERRDTSGRIPVTTITYELSNDEIASVEAEFGAGVLTSRQVEVTTGYRYKGSTTWSTQRSEEAAVDHLRAGLDVPVSTKKATDAATTIQALVEALKEVESQAASAAAVIEKVAGWRESDLGLALIDHLHTWRPAFVYFGDYDSMPGKVSVPDFEARREANTLTRGEQALLSLLELAGVALEDFKHSDSHEHLIRDLENASNGISDEVFEYWSQNTDLAVKLGVLGSPEPDAAPPLSQPPLLQIRVENKRHRVTVPFDERSRGFVWFFSFLAYFDQLERTADQPLILLLDEPGLNLHAKAQADLLRFIDERLAPKHQVLYTTHSPFMIDAHKLNRVRTVVDELATGTVVSGEVLKTDAETAFPLHAALGVELSQTLFVGPDVLLVEGPAEVAYLEVLSSVLKAADRPGLDSRWVITPAGGAGKLPAFVTMLGANKLNTVVLADSSITDTATIDRLREAGRLGVGGLVLVGDLLGVPIADTEDLFEPSFYVDLVNRAYAGILGGKKLKVSELPNDARLVRRVERAFEARGINKGRINHYAPAKALLSQPALHGKISSHTLELAEELFRRINAFKRSDS